MKKVMWAAALSFVVMSACAGEATFESKEAGFSIQFPEKWERKDRVSGTIVAMIAPVSEKKDVFRANANVIEQTVPRDSDLKKFADGTLSVMSKLLKDYKEIERKDIQIGTVPAVRVLYTYKFDDLELKSVQVLAVVGKHGYVITGAAEASKFDDVKQTFDNIVNSFKPL